ncbi:MAG TPA: hypothetical protein VGL33_19105 [Streptosporangiaceae bacterium]
MTFPRLPDHERAWALVERDDGVVYRLYSGTAGPRLPHDIMHLVVERELRISDGIWAGIAAGGPGQPQDQPPGQRAELLADLVACAAALGTLTLEKIRRLTADKLAALPSAERPGAEVDPVLVAVAARALQVEAARWARLRVGEELSYDWPGK